jgi:putative N6-adenine-specific DNA methylase
MTHRGDLECLAVCPPGVEPQLAAELAALGVRRTRQVRGGVEATMRARQLYAANLWCRTATRLLVRVTTFGARTFAELEHHAGAVDWDQWIPDGAPVHFRVTAHRSQLMHTGAVVERLLRACDAEEIDLDNERERNGDPAGQPGVERGGQPGVERGGQPVGTQDGETDREGVADWDDEYGDYSDAIVAGFVVRIDRNRVTLSANASGEPLHHRPWRQHLGPAPLRPTLAAAVLGAIGWPGAPGSPLSPTSPSSPGGRLLLADPFCGSGTLAIEAGLAALGRPPSSGRRFGFEQWADFAPGTWASVRGAAEASVAASAGIADRLQLLVRDRDAGAANDAAANAELAGIDHVLDSACMPVSSFAPLLATGESVASPTSDDVAWIVTNPPWGGRLRGGGDLRDLYATFGRVVRERFGGWRVALVVEDRHLAAHSGLPLHDVLHTTAGGRPMQVLVTEVLG